MSAQDSPKEMFSAAYNHMARSVAAMERTARAAEEIASQLVTNLARMTTDISAVKEATGQIANDVKDTQRLVEQLLVVKATKGEGVSGGLKSYGALPFRSQVLIAIGFVAALLAGGGAAKLLSLFGS